jgi:hypothetical protein
MTQLFSLGAKSFLQAPITAADTSLDVSASLADLFPIANTGTNAVNTPDLDWFKIILENTLGQKEVVYVRTRAAGDATLSNLLRGQEGTTARAFTAGDTAVGQRVTAEDMQGTVRSTGDQTIEDVKTFTEPIIGSTNSQVSLTGDQTIEDVKTFDKPIVGSVTGTSIGSFYKAHSRSVAFSRTSNGTASIKAGTSVNAVGTAVIIAADTAIVMPTLTAGTDYAIYACTDGTVRADASFTAPSGYTTANSRQIGGFHYAPGGNAAAQAGGDTTPQINALQLLGPEVSPSLPGPTRNYSGSR